MNFKAPFAPEVRIRLTNDLNGLVCTVQRGWFHTKCDEFAIKFRRGQSLEPIDGHVVSEPMRAQCPRPPSNL
jgi:hypothetical protein